MNDYSVFNSLIGTSLTLKHRNVRGLFDKTINPEDAVRVDGRKGKYVDLVIRTRRKTRIDTVRIRKWGSSKNLETLSIHAYRHPTRNEMIFRMLIKASPGYLGFIADVSFVDGKTHTIHSCLMIVHDNGKEKNKKVSL